MFFGILREYKILKKYNYIRKLKQIIVDKSKNNLYNKNTQEVMQKKEGKSRNDNKTNK